LKDPTAKTEWTLSYCSECHQETHFWRIRERTFRCLFCGREKQIRDVDHDRDGLLE